MTPAYALDLTPYLYVLGGSIVIAAVLAWWMK